MRTEGRHIHALANAVDKDGRRTNSGFRTCVPGSSRERVSPLLFTQAQFERVWEELDASTILSQQAKQELMEELFAKGPCSDARFESLLPNKGEVPESGSAAHTLETLRAKLLGDLQEHNKLSTQHLLATAACAWPER